MTYLLIVGLGRDLGPDVLVRATTASSAGEEASPPWFGSLRTSWSVVAQVLEV
jgi:hypothetical protein